MHEEILEILEDVLSTVSKLGDSLIHSQRKSAQWWRNLSQE
jgi:hypothetical protein